MTTLAMLTTIIVALITAVIGPLLMTWFKNKLETKPTKKLLEEAIDLNELVSEQLEIIIDELEADRIWIAQFHNGGHFYPTGKSIQKFSIFYETITPNTEPIQSVFQNIPVSLFPKSLSKLYKDGELSIAELNDGEDYDLKPLCVAYGTKSFYMISIYNLDDHFIGVMGIAFNEEYKLSKEDWIFIRQKVGAIGLLLTDYLKTKK
jgi:hypothetical protein